MIRMSNPSSAARSALPGRVLVTVLLLAALHPLAGNSTCDPMPCTPMHPDYDPATGLCTQPANDGNNELGPPVFGTGNLPTEPGTPTTQPAPSHDQDAVALDIYGLNGRWIDSGRAVCIQHTGSAVFATYIEPFVCDHADGTGATSQTQKDFEGQLVGDTITGMTAACRHGFSEPGDNGIIDTTMILVVSPDGKTLSGTWFNSDLNEDIPFSVTRETVGNCHVP